MKTFVLDVKPTINYDKQLRTLVVARIISPDNIHPDTEALISEVITRYGGRLIENDYLTLIVAFEGPGKAVHYSLDLMNSMKNLDMQLVMGIHISEVATDNANFVSGGSKGFINAIIETAQPNQILITQNVKYLLSGSGLIFTQLHSEFRTFSGETSSLFGIKDPDHLNLGIYSAQHNSFFKMVLECIYKHLSDETFNVDTLCRCIGISERQLQRKLKTITNKSPVQLVSSIRLHRAKELILTQEFNIAQVAFQIGFSSPSYFSMRFKKEFGINPSLLLSEN